MKSLKPIMLVVSGMALAFVFAFKTNSNTTAREFTSLEISIADRNGYLKALNELGKDGWQIKSSFISYITSPARPQTITILLEREKTIITINYTTGTVHTSIV